MVTNRTSVGGYRRQLTAIFLWSSSLKGRSGNSKTPGIVSPSLKLTQEPEQLKNTRTNHQEAPTAKVLAEERGPSGRAEASSRKSRSEEPCGNRLVGWSRGDNHQQGAALRDAQGSVPWFTDQENWEVSGSQTRQGLLGLESPFLKHIPSMLHVIS